MGYAGVVKPIHTGDTQRDTYRRHTRAYQATKKREKQVRNEEKEEINNRRRTKRGEKRQDESAGEELPNRGSGRRQREKRESAGSLVFKWRASRLCHCPVGPWVVVSSYQGSNGNQQANDNAKDGDGPSRHTEILRTFRSLPPASCSVPSPPLSRKRPSKRIAEPEADQRER